MDELANAITTVYNGWAMINPDIATKVLRLFSQMAQADYSTSWICGTAPSLLYGRCRPM